MYGVCLCESVSVGVHVCEYVTGNERERGRRDRQGEGEKGTSVRFPFSIERINSLFLI